MSSTASALLKAASLGLVALCASVVLAQFSSSGSVRVNTEAWPPTAQSILVERPGDPLSAEQWVRIERLLRAHGGESQGSHVFAAQVRHSWPLYVVFPLLALVLVRRLRPLTPVAAGLAVLAPSALALLFSFLHTHPYIR